MSGMHPQFLLSKRFPVHTAVEKQDTSALASLLGHAMDARFHLSRKLPDSDVSRISSNVNQMSMNFEVSLLHQACCARALPNPVWPNIVSACLHLGAAVDDPDCVGQTPLFYAVTHCQATEIVPLLIAAGARNDLKCVNLSLYYICSGANMNLARWSDGWTLLHLVAMVGASEVTTLLLNAGANSSIEDKNG